MKKIIFLLLLVPNLAYAETIPTERAVKAIIGEAENQGFHGMLAIACSIKNRGNLVGVYGEHASRVKRGLYGHPSANKAHLAWALATNDPHNCNFLGGADHWENIKAFGKPKWANSMKETYRYKDHVFYKAV